MNKRLFGMCTLALAVMFGVPLLRAQDQPAQPAPAPQQGQAQPGAPAQAAQPAQPPVEEPDASLPNQPGDNGTQIVIPEGTEFKLQLHSSINSKVSKPGDRVLTTLLDPVDVEDEDVLAKGVRIDGHVSEVKEAARRGRGGDLMVVFDTIEMPSGEKVAIQGSLTEVFSAANGGSERVGPEGDLKGKGASHKEQAALVLAPTAIGAAAGGIGPGIAAAGAGIAMAYLIPKGKQATLLAGSLIGMRLDRDVTITLPPQESK
ncbi:MAG TPA: hypothetical protein VGZ29_15050 [Terriglobia bacterium]|nr:hypothetical protein [Terriglobia bacterium]